MAADDALEVRVEPWPSGRRRRQNPPTVPGRPLVLRSYRRPPPPPIDLTAPRPPVVDDTSLLGFSRFTHSKVGRRVYRGAILALYGLIIVQMIWAMVHAV
ncbi:hypothetical protein ACQEVB_06205 [Pseudonocardia sp. CA-107938]|uniref:hypothetical protein n=1 Tax=Pseudonocardia sp. CA-107938 TaxID=3240021 RepID=UPI003D92D236